MCCIDWELASQIATAIGFPFTALGLLIVVVQAYMQRKQSRLDALAAMYTELDSHDARLAREYIYNAPADAVRLQALHAPGHEQERRKVEDTLATLERMSYPIVQDQLPAEDAFNLYGGVLLSIGKKLWPYIEDQRTMRAQSGVTHRLLYRRYLEAAIRRWAPEYAKAVGLPVPSESLGTREMLDWVFSTEAGI